MTINDTRTARERAEEYRQENYPFAGDYSAAMEDCFVAGVIARDSEVPEYDTLAGCTGSSDCPAPAHQHGCFADLKGHCNEPGAHPAEPTTVTAEQITALKALADKFQYSAWPDVVVGDLQTKMRNANAMTAWLRAYIAEQEQAR